MVLALLVFTAVFADFAADRAGAFALAADFAADFAPADLASVLLELVAGAAPARDPAD
jgi:hypothetical protein